MLFTPGQIGTLTLSNRLVRSATAERLADESGSPLHALTAMYRALARGGPLPSIRREAESSYRSTMAGCNAAKRQWQRQLHLQP